MARSKGLIRYLQHPDWVDNVIKPDMIKSHLASLKIAGMVASILRSRSSPAPLIISCLEAGGWGMGMGQFGHPVPHWESSS